MLASVILLCFCTYLFFQFIQIQRPKNFPPGPSPLPLFGNLLHFDSGNPVNDFQKLAKHYGNVYSVFLGHRPVVIISGLRALKEALVIKAADFAGRPQDLMVNAINQNKGVILSDYGPGWREHRRFALKTLRNFGLGKLSMEERILSETQNCMKQLDESVGKILKPEILFHNVASSVICPLLFGADYACNYDSFTKLLHHYTEAASLISGPWSVLYDSITMIRHLPLPFMKAFKIAEFGQALSMDLVTKHKKTRVPGKPRDILDCYLDELDKRGNDGSTWSEEQLIIFALDLHFAGTHTISNTLLFAFLYLMTHTQVQERCQQEIDKVLMGKTQASFEDRHKMPYTQAVIHEVQRVASIVPLSVTHCTTTDTELQGYFIPKGTMVIPNLTSVLFEEEQWKYPHEFNPENFLNDQGEFDKPEAFIPFSLGPRVCLGEGLARIELFLIVVTLLRRFHFIWPEDAGQPDFTPNFGITNSPKPFSMRVQLRVIQ
ncbi:cytochrome P450 2B4-like [Lampris incognitus]|uniref:cytochrome P450 2B4-like n=1 Tax=Lampris incognitus TaxID=2546036 RepID=UPI0024B5DF4C|nr:cytochrome P450 2B4-like [Lampris incognitus]